MIRISDTLIKLRRQFELGRSQFGGRSFNTYRWREQEHGNDRTGNPVVSYSEPFCISKGVFPQIYSKCPTSYSVASSLFLNQC